MSTAVLWSGSAMVVGAVPLAWWALFTDRTGDHRARQNLSGFEPTLREAELERSPVERMVLPATRKVGGRLIRFTPIGWVDRRKLLLAKAGISGRFSVEQVLGAKLLLPILVTVALGMQLFDTSEPRLMLMAVSCVVVAFFVPDLLIRAKADRRADAITQALPDVLDQITISVEAGLGFEAALSRIGASRDHPLSEELLRMLQDMRLGSTRSDALRALAERSQVDDMKSVVVTLRQADSLGAPMSATLRNVAAEVREKRRFRAETKAQRLPTLMMFPLALCILPALFIIILGPAFLSSR